MGLIKAFTGALGGTLADQWLEFIACPSSDLDTLVQKGEPVSSRRGSNFKRSDNLISNGSKIMVEEGQCALIVEDGRVVDFCAEAGGFIWDKSSEPSLFCGSFGQGLVNAFKTTGHRFTYGGETGRDQRVYYVNTKELRDAKFGTPTPIPFALSDEETGYKAILDLSCYGTYTYRIVNPVQFFMNVCGSVERAFKREELDDSIKPELLDALNPAFAKIASQKISYEELPGKTNELKQALNEELKPYWIEARGIAVQRFNIMSISVANKEVLEDFREAQKMKMIQRPQMAAAYALHAQGEAMKSAASNANGAMTGLMGMNLAGGGFGNGLGSAGLQSLQQQPQVNSVSNSEDEWCCNCKTTNHGNFCSSCGNKKPQPAPVVTQHDWTCLCGTPNVGRFCHHCGQKKPEPKIIICDKCGYHPEPGLQAKFCPECGDVFNEQDVR